MKNSKKKRRLKVTSYNRKETFHPMLGIITPETLAILDILGGMEADAALQHLELAREYVERISVVPDVREKWELS